MKKPINVRVTSEGFDKFKKELLELIGKRPEVVTRMSAARE